MTSLSLSPAAQATLKCERQRAVGSGIVESGLNTFFLLILVRLFDAGPLAKGIVASSPFVGLFLSPLLVFLARRSRRRAASIISVLALGSGVAYLLGGFVSTLPLYVTTIVVAVALPAACVPLYTSIYHDNYPAHARGQLFASTTVLRLCVGMAFGLLAGAALTGRLEWYPMLHAIFALCLFGSAYAISRCPSEPLPVVERNSLFNGFKYLRTDALFRNTLLCWMLLGFGNIMMICLRVEYLANPRYGLALSEAQVAVLVTTIPAVARLATSRAWGMLFDRLDFFSLRIVLNFGFLAGFLAFFCSADPAGLVIAALLIGAAGAGGDLAWQLWVTKFSPPDRVADYMAVHTTFTGVRGLIAPLLGFYLADATSITFVATLGAVLILLANFGLFFESRTKRM